jgi:hypothetical protein
MFCYKHHKETQNECYIQYCQCTGIILPWPNNGSQSPSDPRAHVNYANEKTIKPLSYYGSAFPKTQRSLAIRLSYVDPFFGCLMCFALRLGLHCCLYYVCAFYLMKIPPFSGR